MSVDIKDMTLRDYFAAKALVGYAANARVMDSVIQNSEFDRDQLNINVSKSLAGLAYKVADAMMAERSKTGDN